MAIRKTARNDNIDTPSTARRIRPVLLSGGRKRPSAGILILTPAARRMKTMATAKRPSRKMSRLSKYSCMSAGFSSIIGISHPVDTASRVSRRTSEDTGLSRVNPCRRASARVKWARRAHQRPHELHVCRTRSMTSDSSPLHPSSHYRPCGSTRRLSLRVSETSVYQPSERETRNPPVGATSRRTGTSTPRRPNHINAPPAAAVAHPT